MPRGCLQGLTSAWLEGGACVRAGTTSPPTHTPSRKPLVVWRWRRYFASVEVDGERYMTPDDFIRAITPYNPHVDGPGGVGTSNPKYAFSARKRSKEHEVSGGGVAGACGWWGWVGGNVMGATPMAPRTVTHTTKHTHTTHTLQYTRTHPTIHTHTHTLQYAHTHTLQNTRTHTLQYTRTRTPNNTHTHPTIQTHCGQRWRGEAGAGEGAKGPGCV
jgi:hypothetical protein